MTEIFKGTQDFFEKGDVLVFHSGRRAIAEIQVEPEKKGWAQTLKRLIGIDALKRLFK